MVEELASGNAGNNFITFTLLVPYDAPGVREPHVKTPPCRVERILLSSRGSLNGGSAVVSRFNHAKVNNGH